MSVLNVLAGMRRAARPPARLPLVPPPACDPAAWGAVSVARLLGPDGRAPPPARARIALSSQYAPPPAAAQHAPAPPALCSPPSAPLSSAAPRSPPLAAARSPPAPLPCGVGVLASRCAVRGVASSARAFASKHAPQTTKVGDMRLRINDSLPRIEEDIACLLKEELEVVHLNALKLDALRDTLVSSGFSIHEEDAKVSLTRVVEDHTVTMSWDPTVKPLPHVELGESDAGVAGEDYEAMAEALRREQEGAIERVGPDGLSADEAEGEGDESDEDEDGERVSSDIDVEVRIANASGKELVAQCAVAEDGLLYIYRLADGAGGSTLDLESVSRTLQHRMYDYLDSLGVGDSAAAFVQRYNAQYHTTLNLEGLQHLADMFGVEEIEAGAEAPGAQ